MDRREFLSAATASSLAAIVGFDPSSRLWVLASQEPPPSFERLPKLDGLLLLDDAMRTRFSRDDGNLIRRMPAAVLQPRSIRDVSEMLRYCNKRNIKVALRGQGHSRYGQTLVAGGLVIDSSTLTAIGTPNGSTIDVQPGASWGKIADATIAAGLTPPVMPDTMRLTAGGTLSVGGFGNTSHHYGAQIDNVEELEVVTGSGDVVKCSASTNTDLFEMVLAGLGQCAMIVRARLRLIPAPRAVVWKDYVYDDIDTWLADHMAAVSANRFDHHGGGVLRQDDGSHRFMIYGAVFEFAGRATISSPRRALRARATSAPRRMTYHEYLHRQAEMIDRLYNTDLYLRPAPYLTVWVPATRAKDVVLAIMATPAPANNFARFGVWPIKPMRFTRPLLPMPAWDTGFIFWLFRTAPVGDEQLTSAYLESNHSIAKVVADAGGKRYAPYAMVMTPAEWRAHFGEIVWQRLSAAKKRYDPRGILTPGPGIFG
jgi:cytokinin dehydrogenase